MGREAADDEKVTPFKGRKRWEQLGIDGRAKKVAETGVSYRTDIWSQDEPSAEEFSGSNSPEEGKPQSARRRQKKPSTKRARGAADTPSNLPAWEEQNDADV